MERSIAFKGAALILVGRALKTGEGAPDFKVTSQELKTVGLADFEGKVKVINSFPSLDTPVCDSQVREFNKRAQGMSSEVVILGISKDLPFAQKRFCQAQDINSVVVLSDYKTSSFGINYGLLIKELALLARAVIIVDKSNFIRYIQVAPELSKPLDYEEALRNLERVLSNPQAGEPAQAASKCQPCEQGASSLPKETIDRLLAQHRGWQLVEDRKIIKDFKFRDFQEAKYFLDLISVVAEEQGHHPGLVLSYNKLKVTLTTHASGGLTDNDFIMAGIIDRLAE